MTLDEVILLNSIKISKKFLTNATVLCEHSHKTCSEA